MIVLQHTPKTNIDPDTKMPIDYSLITATPMLEADVSTYLTTNNAEVVSMWTQADWDKMQINNAAEIRRQRNQLLAETDWYGASDVVMPAVIKTWRQSLRDITLDPAFPNVTLPVKPI